MQLPVVFTGQEFGGGISVLDDNLAAGEELGRYVAARGLRRAGLLWVTEDDMAVGLRRKEGVLRGEPVSKTQLIGYRFVEGGSVL